MVPMKTKMIAARAWWSEPDRNNQVSGRRKIHPKCCPSSRTSLTVDRATGTVWSGRLCVRFRRPSNSTQVAPSDISEITATTTATTLSDEWHQHNHLVCWDTKLNRPGRINSFRVAVVCARGGFCGDVILAGVIFLWIFISPSETCWEVDPTWENPKGVAMTNTYVLCLPVSSLPLVAGVNNNSKVVQIKISFSILNGSLCKLSQVEMFLPIWFISHLNLAELKLVQCFN
jgi:hypothetical protein